MSDPKGVKYSGIELPHIENSKTKIFAKYVLKEDF